MADKQLYISVIGAGDKIDEVTELKASELGRVIAKRGHILVCGGLGGVMDAAAGGVKLEGGVSIGILPFDNRDLASPNLTYSIPIADDPSKNIYPMAITASGSELTYVGRIRKDKSVKHGLNLWVVSDNLLKGAALNAVQISECLIS